MLDGDVVVEGNVVGGGGEVDRLHRLRKKMFWNRNSANATASTDSSVAAKHSRSKNNLESESDAKISTATSRHSNQHSAANRLDAKKNSKNWSNFTNTAALQIPTLRSNSLHYTTKSNEINKFAKSDTEQSANVGTHYHSNSNLKPFYSKLKKTHLFGVKLEKICGPYSTLNNKLPPQIMVSLDIYASIDFKTTVLGRRRNFSANL